MICCHNASTIDIFTRHLFHLKSKRGQDGAWKLAVSNIKTNQAAVADSEMLLSIKVAERADEDSDVAVANKLGNMGVLNKKIRSVSRIYVRSEKNK